MENESEITQIITTEVEVEPQEYLETEEIQDIEDGTLNVIPFQLIKLGQNVKSSNIVQAGTSSQPSNKTNFDDVKGTKYSKYYKQTYRPAWELMPDFKGWLKGVSGEPTRAFCTYCRKTLHAHRLSLLKHTCTIRHQKAAQLHGNSPYDLSPDDNDIETVIVNEEGLLNNDPLSSAEEEDNNSTNDVTTQQNVVYQSNNDENQENNSEEEEGDSSNPPNTNQNKFEKTDSNLKVVSSISTKVVDITRGCPVTGLSVSLYKLIDGRWTYMNEGLTDNKGRCSNFFKNNSFSKGRYKLHYDVDRYFEFRKQLSSFPFIETIFDCPTLTKYHFSLLLGPNSYTTYRLNFSE